MNQNESITNEGGAHTKRVTYEEEYGKIWQRAVNESIAQDFWLRGECEKRRIDFVEFCSHKSPVDQKFCNGYLEMEDKNHHRAKLTPGNRLRLVYSRYSSSAQVKVLMALGEVDVPAVECQENGIEKLSFDLKMTGWQEDVTKRIQYLKRNGLFGDLQEYVKQYTALIVQNLGAEVRLKLRPFLENALAHYDACKAIDAPINELRDKLSRSLPQHPVVPNASCNSVHRYTKPSSGLQDVVRATLDAALPTLVARKVCHTDARHSGPRNCKATESQIYEYSWGGVSYRGNWIRIDSRMDKWL
jgi:hypothetical protein